jgi:hypothetical protein
MAARSSMTRLAEMVLGAARTASRADGRTHTITGFAPYLLGSAAGPLLNLSGGLTEGSWPAWNVAVHAPRYGREIEVPIGRTHYRAKLGVQVWNARVAAVLVDWPRSSFNTAEEWRRAAWTLRDDLAATYAPQILTNRHRLDDDALVLAEADDAAGNRLVATAADGTVSLIYVWGDFARTFPAMLALSRTAEAFASK